MTNLFAANRERLLVKLNSNLVVVTAYTNMQRSNDIVAAFEQEANFWWLTGIDAPDWWLIMDSIRGKTWLVSPTEHTSDNDAQYEDALVTSGVDGILTLDAGMQMLRELAKKHSVVRTLREQPRSDHLNFSLNPAPRKMHDTLSRLFIAVQDCRKELTQLRAIKQPEEIARIKKAADLTVAAFKHIKPNLSEARYEYEIEAEFTYYFRKHGAKGHAYDPVVAAGDNASNLQYIDNGAKLKKRETILIDVGARLNGYMAGVARTYVYGEPTRRQRAVHEALRQAHAQIIALLGPNLAVDQYQREVDAIMQDTLISLGLMSSRDDSDSYRRYFPHAISHGIGVDVHDSLGAPHFFQPNMVLTVEPGIYIPEEKIGMRLEDTILITPTGTINLSARLSTEL
jgi:Xaa-Pro aminopeptidase